MNKIIHQLDRHPKPNYKSDINRTTHLKHLKSWKTPKYKRKKSLANELKHDTPF